MLCLSWLPFVLVILGSALALLALAAGACLWASHALWGTTMARWWRRDHHTP
jgi:hypothetical protein